MCKWKQIKCSEHFLILTEATHNNCVLFMNPVEKQRLTAWNCLITFALQQQITIYIDSN